MQQKDANNKDVTKKYKSKGVHKKLLKKLHKKRKRYMHKMPIKKTTLETMKFYSNKRRFLILLSLIIIITITMLISSCSFSKTGFSILNIPPSEQTTPVEVFFCPLDDCAGVLINYSLNSDDIRCAFYDLRLERLIHVLNKTEAQVVLNDKNFYSNHDLYNGMVNVRGYRSPSLMHHKFCVFDEEIVITGSMNPTERGNYQNDNNIVVINSTYLTQNYLNEFERLWYDKKSGFVRYPEIILNGYKVRNYFCPKDCYSGIYTDLIREANSTVYFMTFSFTRDDIGDELISAHNRGVDVKGVFERTQNNQWNQYSRLKEASLNVRWDNNPANMHHKVFIIDNKTVITGSTNPSNNGLTRNDENIIIFEKKGIARQYLDEFKRVWDH